MTISKDHLEEINYYQREFKLSVTQCCQYLENKYGHSVSRVRMFSELSTMKASDRSEAVLGRSEKRSRN